MTSRRYDQPEPTGTEDLERQLADRMPPLREWIATFDATDLLAPDELQVVKGLLTAAAP
nr:hypothetical protein GCM10020063_092150 [Dactylosporangium thailandense]